MIHCISLCYLCLLQRESTQYLDRVFAVICGVEFKVHLEKNSFYVLCSLLLVFLPFSFICVFLLTLFTHEKERTQRAQNKVNLFLCVHSFLNTFNLDILDPVFSICRNSILFREIYGDYIRFRIATKRDTIWHVAHATNA